MHSMFEKDLIIADSVSNKDVYAFQKLQKESSVKSH